MRRHVIRMCRRRRNRGIFARGPQRRFSQNRVVTAMNNVVRYAWMVRLFRKQREQNVYALSLVGKSLVSLRRDDVECQCMKDGSFTVLWIRTLKRRHLLFKSPSMCVGVAVILTVDFRQCVDVSPLTCCTCPAQGHLLCLPNGFPPGYSVPVFPQSVIVRHRNSPVRHRTRGILLGDCLERTS